MREIMKYEDARIRNALVGLGVNEESLDEYIKRISNTEIFYRYPKSIEDYLDYDDLAADVLKSKYLGPKENGPIYIWDRLSRAMCSVENLENQEYWYKEFFSILKDFKFVPGGRVMHGGGRTEVKREPTLSNCYVIPIEPSYSSDEIANLDPKIRTKVSNIVMDASRDGKSYEETFLKLEKLLPKKEISKILFPADSLEGIYQNLKEAALVYRTGGGVGTDLSVLRPEGSNVNSTMNHAPGVTAFMDLLSESTETVAQEGRRGALMLTLRVSHPDIEKFITIKNDPKRKKVEHANISTLVTDDFMRAVEADEDYTLYWENKDPQNKELSRVERKVKAKDLWLKIIKNAHASAEPGIIFWDTMKAYHNVEYANPLSSTNPCGEQPLAKYTACNLGNLNLALFVDDNGNFNFSELKRTARTAIRFMDNIISYNLENHALGKIRKAVNGDRRIGLGVTALGDALVKMKVRYDSEKGIEVAEKLMRTIRDVAYGASIDLAMEKGRFPLFNWEGYSQSKFVQSLPEEMQDKIKEYGIRNGTIVTVPPVGTGSIVIQSSSGIEPIFSIKSRRNVKKPTGSRGETQEYKVMHPLIRKLFGTEENLPDYVVTAHDIDPYFRVKMQSVIQKYVDSAISSTINLPEDISMETIADIYMQAWRQGLKGVTVYREGSREGVMKTEGFANKKNDSLENKIMGRNGYIHPRKRPTRTIGYTERTKTSKGHMYVTFGEDEFGLCEVFAAIGKAGGEGAAQAEAISRLASLAFRSNVDPMEVVNELKGIAGPDVVFAGENRKIYSIPDALGQIIEDYLISKKNGNEKLEKKKETMSSASYEGHKKITSPCPQCGEQAEHTTSCVVCYNCGWSKC